MLKTGLVGSLAGCLLKDIISHPGFKITGCFYPDDHSRCNKSTRFLPLLSKEMLFEKNDVLIFQRADNVTRQILSEALKRTKHIMLADTGVLSCREVDELIKLREEAQTVFKKKQTVRNIPSLNTCQTLMVFPSLIEISLKQTSADRSIEGSVTAALFRMIDTLLFLCPFNIKRIRVLKQPQIYSSTSLISSSIEFENGTVSNLLYTNIAEKKSFVVDIYQRNKNLTTDLLKDKLKATERSEITNKINSKTLAFKNKTIPSFYGELDNFYYSIINNDTSGKELFEIFRVIEISSEIIKKSSFPDTV